MTDQTVTGPASSSGPASSTAASGSTAAAAGLEALFGRPLLETIWRRRTHRVSRGSSVNAGSMSYRSTRKREPLTELEEAVLIALTGCTGLTMPDRPFADPRNGAPIMSKPNLNMAGRAAGRPTCQKVRNMLAPSTRAASMSSVGTAWLRYCVIQKTPNAVTSPGTITAVSSPVQPRRC